MEIFQEQVQGSAEGSQPITILKLVGDMDGSNFRDAISTVEHVCEAGARNLLIDLSEMRFMSSAGLAALHHMAVMMRKKYMPTVDDSWSSLDDLKKKAGTLSGHEEHIKLLNPQERVRKSLEMVGYDRIFDIFTDREAALASFH